MNSLVSTILITVVILAVVFLILREVYCWYWKINDRIKLQVEQNIILNEILSELRNETKSKQKTTQRKKSKDEVEESDMDEAENDDAFSGESEKDDNIELTKEEQQQVDAFINFGLNPGERLVISKLTRKIDRFDDKEWTNVDQSKWIIIAEK